MSAIAAPVTRVLGAIRRRAGEAGQNLVEFAMLLPLMLVLIFGLVDFGRAFYTWLILTNAAREGARVGAVQGTQNDITTRVNDSIPNLDQSSLTITITNAEGNRGEPVEVDLEYPFEYVTPIGSIISLMSGGGNFADFTLTSHASMRLE